MKQQEQYVCKCMKVVQDETTLFTVHKSQVLLNVEKSVDCTNYYLQNFIIVDR